MRPEVGWVGVLARDIVVLVVGVVALDVLPLACGLFVVDGELDRVDEVLEEPCGLLSFLTDRGSLEAAGGGFCEVVDFREAGLRLVRCDVFSFACPLNELDRSLEGGWLLLERGLASAFLGAAV